MKAQQKNFNQEKSKGTQVSCRILTASTAALLAVSLSACSSNVPKIAEYMENGQYEEAISLFESKELSEKDRAELVSQLADSLAKLPDKFATDEVTYDRVNDEITTIYRMNLYELDSDIATIKAKIDALQASKVAYASAEEAYSQKDFLSAYNFCLQVIEDDVNYDSARELQSKALDEYKDLLANEVERLVQNDQYDDAIIYLDNTRNSTTIKEITDYIEELTDATKRDYSLGIAEEYVQSNDYGNALTVIKEYLSENNISIEADDEIKKIYTDYESKYVELIISRATELCDQENYLQALSVLNSALQLSDAEELHEMVEHINEVKPNYLADLTVSDQDRYDVISEGDQLHDTLGNVYSPDPNLFELSSQVGSWGDDSIGFATYNLGYRYNTIKGTVTVDDVSSQLEGMQFQILGDDVVIFSSPVNRTTTPISVNIDVSTVNWLKFTIVRGEEVEGSNGDNITCIMSDFILK